MHRPICIMAMPRSGSSMVAGVFAAHGVWCGNCEPPSALNAKGYFENIAIKTHMKRRWPGLVRNDGLAKPQAGFLDEVADALDAEGYPGGPWFVKMSAMFWPAWAELEPKWVVVRRKPESIVASNIKTAMMGPRDHQQVSAAVHWHNREIDRLISMGSVEIRSDDIVAGDLSSIAAAFEHCAIRFNPAIARGFIDCSLWHHG